MDRNNWILSLMYVSSANVLISEQRSTSLQTLKVN